MPFLVGKTLDLDSRVVHVDLALALPCGTDPDTIDFRLSANGENAIVSFAWPGSFYNIEELYEEEIENNERVDSTMEALLGDLRNCSSQAIDVPRSKITIGLPTPVQTNSTSFVRKGKRARDGAVILKAKFKAQQQVHDIVDYDDGRVKFSKIEDKRNKSSVTD